MSSDIYQNILNPSLRPGYRCTINVSEQQNKKKKTVLQMVMCFTIGLTLLSSSASVIFAKTALDEQAVASFTSTTITAVF